MFACIDVGYRETTATAACLTFATWETGSAMHELVLYMDNIEPYVPGEFYRRELPCVMEVLAKLPNRPEAIVVDGYVWLDAAGRKGLGGYLFAALGESVPIIGAAKTRFATATSAIEVFRGSSRRPLLVTAVGISPTEAADCIRRMHGPNRIPTLLKRVDQLSRGSRPCGAPGAEQTASD